MDENDINVPLAFNAAEFISAKPTMPHTITAAKERGTSFFRVVAYNEDELNEIS